MYHSFFIHLFVDGYLGCFHTLAIVNSAAVNTVVHVSFSIIVGGIIVFTHMRISNFPRL